jgi:ribonucleoside-diphosphate reductase alpha chain
VQFDTTINEWHTCPADGRINASNPCSEYMFLDDTACNLASMNLAKFLRHEDGTSTSRATHACAPVDRRARDQRADGELPEPVEIAKLSYEFRTLGLGYANLGTS